MKICLWCGATSADDKETCPKCGRVIYKEKPVSAPIPEPLPNPDIEAGAQVEKVDGLKEFPVEGSVTETPVIAPVQSEAVNETAEKIEPVVPVEPTEPVAPVAEPVAEKPAEVTAEAPVPVPATEQDTSTPPKE